MFLQLKATGYQPFRIGFLFELDVSCDTHSEISSKDYHMYLTNILLLQTLLCSSKIQQRRKCTQKLAHRSKSLMTSCQTRTCHQLRSWVTLKTGQYKTVVGSLLTCATTIRCRMYMESMFPLKQLGQTWNSVQFLPRILDPTLWLYRTMYLQLSNAFTWAWLVCWHKTQFNWKILL